VKKAYSGSISPFHMEIYKLEVMLKPCNSRIWTEKNPVGETEIQSTQRTLTTKTRYNLGGKEQNCHPHTQVWQILTKKMTC
jgi:hypothetical protein